MKKLPLKKLWGKKPYTYKEAWGKASKRNEKILAKAEIGQEIIVAGGYRYDKSFNEVEHFKLGAKHPELVDKLTNKEIFDFEEKTIIYAGNGVCYYTGNNTRRKGKVRPHYNDASAWMAL